MANLNTGKRILKCQVKKTSGTGPNIGPNKIVLCPSVSPAISFVYSPPNIYKPGKTAGKEVEPPAEFLPRVSILVPKCNNQFSFSQ